MTAQPAAAPSTQALDLEALRTVEEFLIHEADLLDQRRFEEWGALFTEDGIYWVPAMPGQDNPFDTISIFYDDKEGRDVRIRRLRHPRNLVEEAAPTRTLHVVQNVRAEAAGDGEIRATSRLLMLEYREGVQRLYGATCEHRLRPRAGGFAIAYKRVDLLNCDGFLPMMSIPF
jgi:benzoate/toluate 1,2-dioxygenase beta subunit